MRRHPVQTSVHARRQRGFTLIELLVVLAIVAVLLTLAVPKYFKQVDASKDTVLRENLRVTRLVIDKFHADLGRYPDTLQELVDRQYLRALPVDPVTESSSTWVLVPAPSGDETGIFDLRSGAPGNDRDGKPYAQM
jgi:general secretion pathway protein G